MHPCAKKSNKPAWCTKKRSAKKSARKATSKPAKGKKMSCACPKGFKRQGIMCKKGRTVKRATCKRKSR